jgi:hypothetical protein
MVEHIVGNYFQGTRSTYQSPQSDVYFSLTNLANSHQSQHLRWQDFSEPPLFLGPLTLDWLMYA